jgi:hypothetical protein
MKLQELRMEFEELSSELELCRSPALRRKILKRIKILVQEIDTFLDGEVLRCSAPRIEHQG